jgi:hypothetical protein
MVDLSADRENTHTTFYDTPPPTPKVRGGGVGGWRPSGLVGVVGAVFPRLENPRRRRRGDTTSDQRTASGQTGLGNHPANRVQSQRAKVFTPQRQGNGI